MDGNTKEETRSILSTEQIANYSAALKKILLFQSSKGYWGRGSLENKVTYTSQGIQLMQALGISHNDKRFKKATRWLEDHVEEIESHWTTRVELGLKINDFQKLATIEDIDHFLRDLNYDLEHQEEKERLNLFWDVIPTLIALYPYENRIAELKNKVVPHNKVIERIIENSEDLGDTATVQFQANHTGLAVLYLSTIATDYSMLEYRDKMIKWLFATREENASHISWQGGRGITSYVLIDLLSCGVEQNKLRKFLPKIIKFICPDSKGNVNRDIATTFDTKLHAEPLYVSMLVLRAMTEVLKMGDLNRISEIRNRAFNCLWYEAIFAKIKRLFYYNKKKISMIICLTLCIVGCIFYVLNKPFIASLFLTTGASSALAELFQKLRQD